MQSAYDRYWLWRKNALEDVSLQQELRDIEADDAAVYDRFYRELSFGTGGLRGVLGAGTNRMNIYTVRKATQGLADYLNRRYEKPAVAIAFDSRIQSDRFAMEAARVLAGNNIVAHLFSSLQPTPVLSYAVRELRCQAGIMVTASHNPAQYNGYKCYGADGCQMTDADAQAVTDCIRAVDIFSGVRVADEDAARGEGWIRAIDPALLSRYEDCVAAQQIHPGACRETPLQVIYTPLNGTGNRPVRAILERIGVQKVMVVPQQEQPDGHFPSVPYPNPEIREAYTLALELAKDAPADLLLATDPDCDRMGVAARDGEEYVFLTGNEVGCLLLDYCLAGRAESGRLPRQPVAVKTIVTSDLAAKIAQAYGCEMREVLTGFKYIGEQIGLLEKAHEADRFVFGFEESYGYLAGSYVRDKDGVVASMLVCEMAAYYKAQGKTLPGVLEQLYARHGFYRHGLVNVMYEGAQGMTAMDRLMTALREQPPVYLGGRWVVSRADYWRSVQIDADGKEREISLPKANVLSFSLEGGASLIVRPSGTEPKIKAYVTATGSSLADAQRQSETLYACAKELLQA